MKSLQPYFIGVVGVSVARLSGDMTLYAIAGAVFLLAALADVGMLIAAWWLRRETQRITRKYEMRQHEALVQRQEQEAARVEEENEARELLRMQRARTIRVRGAA